MKLSNGSSSNPPSNNIDIEISGSFHQQTYRGIFGNGEWHKFRQDFYTSGSSGASSQLKLTFTCVSHSAASDEGTVLDSVFVRRWEGQTLVTKWLPLMVNFMRMDNLMGSMTMLQDIIQVLQKKLRYKTHMVDWNCNF